MASAAPSQSTSRILASPSPAELEGASALAARQYVIPPPRWLTGRPPPAPLTARLKGFASWRADPFQE